MHAPAPRRILWADVLRDGGSYQLGYVDDCGRNCTLHLPVRRERSWRNGFRDARVGYLPPRLTIDAEAAATTLDWEAAEALHNQLLALLHPAIELGGPPRANEMLHLLGRRGGL